MSNEFGTAAYWLERAEEAHAVADQMHDENAKRAMESVAAGYTKIAARTQARELRTLPRRSAVK